MAVQVEWDSKVCSHSGNCVKTLPQVFKENFIVNGFDLIVFDLIIAAIEHVAQFGRFAQVSGQQKNRSIFFLRESFTPFRLPSHFLRVFQQSLERVGVDRLHSAST